MSGMISLTCRNHTGAEYLTKTGCGPRSLHWVRADPQVVREAYPDLKSDVPENVLGVMQSSLTECKCPTSDLVVNLTKF